MYRNHSRFIVSNFKLSYFNLEFVQIKSKEGYVNTVRTLSYSKLVLSFLCCEISNQFPFFR